MKAAAFALLFLLSTAFAGGVVMHSVKVYVQEDDSAEVEEVYTLQLPEEWEREQLKAVLEETPVDFGKLEQYGIRKTVKGNASSETIIPTIRQSSTVEIKIAYLITPIAELIEERGRKQVMGIKGEQFMFWDGNKFDLPYEPATNLRIYIPSKYTIFDWNPNPFYNTTIEDKRGKFYELEWDYKEPIGENDFHVNYERDVEITSRLSLDAFIKDLQEKYLSNPIYMIAIGIIVVIIIWYRKEIWLMIGEAFAGEPEHEDD